LLQNLISKVDMLVLGGGMANTFLAAKGVAHWQSLSEPDMYDTARKIMADAEQRGCHIVLPKDVVVAPALKEGVATQTVPVNAVPADQMILDIGTASATSICNDISMCKTICMERPARRL